MENFTVSLFGHREIIDDFAVEDALDRIVRGLLREHMYIEFLIGRSGEFDECAASVMKRALRAMGEERGNLTLVLPYRVGEIRSYESYYHGVCIPDCVERVHPKGAFERRNRWMVDRADLLIVYVGRPSGGAYKTVLYAQKKGKSILNLYEEISAGYGRHR